MNIVNAGSRFVIYGEDVKTYHELPVGTYDVNFNPKQGYSLVTREPLVVNEDKIYGSSLRKVTKVLDAFAAANRNLGVILSGKKGIGKSLFARILAGEANQIGLPLLNVTGYTPGIASFISSITQEVIVLFDEFEKTFSNANRDEGDPQEELLPLFDGTDAGKKLFVVTCNDTYRLNDFLVNRPGRFHYHFTLNAPSAEEIIEYLTDKLAPQYIHNIPEVVSLSIYTELTYDCLRAIAFELNRGYSLKESLQDLNITRGNDSNFDIFITFRDGSIGQISSCDVNFSYNDIENEYFSYNGKRGAGRLVFNPQDIIFDTRQGTIYLPSADAEVIFNVNAVGGEAEKNRLESIGIEKVVFIRSIPATNRIMV